MASCSYTTVSVHVWMLVANRAKVVAYLGLGLLELFHVVLYDFCRTVEELLEGVCGAMGKRSDNALDRRLNDFADWAMSNAARSACD